MVNNEEVGVKFIPRAKFDEDFLPFKKGEEIFFDGKYKVQELIKFYLKNKGVENYKENAERFEINCLLGNNGGGKSRLLNKFFYIFNNGEITGWDRNKPIISVFDKFDRISVDSDLSIHSNFFQGEYNKFYYDVYVFLEKYKNKKFFSKFLNLKENFFYDLSISSIELENYDFKNFMDYDFLEKINGGGMGFGFSKYLEDILKIYNIFSKTNEKKIENFFILNLDALLGTFYFFVKYEKEYFLEKKGELNNKNIKELVHILDIYLKKIKVENRFKEIFNLNNVPREEKFFSDFKEIFQEYKEKNNKNIKFKIEDFIKYGDVSFLFNKNIFKSDLLFSNNPIEKSSEKLSSGVKSFNDLSSGEKSILVRFTNIYMKIIEDIEEYNNGEGKENGSKLEHFTILIDEPDLHLHLDWQKKYIQKLIDVFSTLDSKINLHFIIATHSPFIISDLPNECIIILDGKGSKTNDTEFTKIRTYNGTNINELKENKKRKFEKYEDVLEFEKKNNKNKKSFGANFVDIIRDGFFFENEVLMGSFAENIIGNIADKRRKEITNNEKIKEKDLVENIEKEIGDDFLRDNLLYFKGKNND